MKAMVLIPSPSHDDWTLFTPYKIYPVKDDMVVNNLGIEFPYENFTNRQRIDLDIPYREE